MQEIESTCRVAALLANHLINLVLQEGCKIANAALESGRPREYLSMRKNVRSDLTYVIPTGEDAAYVDTVADNFIEGADNARSDLETNLLVTSTPQKITDDRPKKENGQGDEDIEASQIEPSNSTSLFINHLFDTPDVELGICDSANLIQNEVSSRALMSNFMDLYVNAALDAILLTKEKEKSFVKQNETPGNASVSYIEEELSEVEKDVIYYIEDYVPSHSEITYEIQQDRISSQMALQKSDDNNDIKVESSELYENTYLTLNRDYEQCSDEEDFPILKDPKGMVMQEIALLAADTYSYDSDPVTNEPEEENKEAGGLAATSGVSTSSRRSRLMQRCRLHGARLLACLRGWWRRKAPGKRKEVREPGSRRGRCPCSPAARRRAASLQDHPVSSTSNQAQKCNTINEAIRCSSHWMEYTFEEKSNDCGDV